MQTRQLEDSSYNTETALDDLQQYIRRDCVDVSGIPALKVDYLKVLAVEVGNLMSHNIKEEGRHLLHIDFQIQPIQKGKL